MERIHESAIRLSEMVNNLVSYANIVTEKQKDTAADQQDEALTV